MMRFVASAAALALAVAVLPFHDVLADSRSQGNVRRRVDCQVSEWPEKFDACDASGFKSKTRVVLVEPSRGGSPCPATIFKTKCTRKECWMGAWSDWVCDATTGMKRRTRAIAPGGLQDSKKCKVSVQRIACDPIPCELNTLEEDTDNPWGPCKLKRGVWTKSKALGIKSPAQYGGVCFEENHPVRKVTAVCEPVDCVVTPVDQDTGAWGECQETSPNVWTKTKTLGITPALYGGQPCSDASRVATASCAQDCMWSATEYDPWTECDADNFKYHPFKITQEPKYGGQPCPPIEERADKDTCGVDCVLSGWSNPSTCAPTSEPKRWAATSMRTILTQPSGSGALCGELKKLDYDLCPTMDCEVSVTVTDCAINNNKNWVKTSTTTVTTMPENGGDACPAIPETPVVVRCDEEYICDSETDPTQRAACAAAIAKVAPLQGDLLPNIFPIAEMPSPTAWQCIEECASLSGCAVFNWWDGYCLLFAGAGPTLQFPGMGLVTGTMLSVKGL